MIDVAAARVSIELVPDRGRIAVRVRANEAASGDLALPGADCQMWSDEVGCCKRPTPDGDLASSLERHDSIGRHIEPITRSSSAYGPIGASVAVPARACVRLPKRVAKGKLCDAS